MSNITHEYPRAYEAASKVDPLILANALDHIAKAAQLSRSQTRRIRWIEQRALVALRGEEYRDIDVYLPKSAGPNTAEKLQKRMAYHIAIKNELLEALQEAELVLAEKMRRLGADPAVSPTTHRIRAAIAKATGTEGGAA